MGNKRTGEPQYRDAIELMKKRPERMGLMSGWSWHDDPKRLVFYLSRYKFVAKMLEGGRSRAGGRLRGRIRYAYRGPDGQAGDRGGF